MTRRAWLRVRGEAADHLPPGRRGRSFEVHFELPVGLRDLVQAQGIPHGEVGRVVVDGEACTWERRLRGGEHVEVASRYPSRIVDPRFVLDGHLGGLARDLRLLGFDAAWERDADDVDLAASSATEGRTLLTRDRGLLMRSVVERGRFVRATDPFRQTVEVLGAFDLADRARPLTRCLECGRPLVAADPQEAAGRVPERILSLHDDFRRCAGCGRVYWTGSHARRLRERAEALLRAAGG